ncbi:MAG: tetratricopeptide repeat protein [Pseudomonadota bacterium]|nr:tetratricopeptide repeat protein [Pseudomonadota bacterium]
MAAYSDDEQVEALKRWWDANGRSVFVGVLIGLVALLGWRGWVNYQENKSAAASTHYANLQTAVERNDTKVIKAVAKVLEESFASTPYAALAALQLARLYAEANDLKASEAQLRWAIEHSPQESVEILAKLRLARVLTAEGKLDAALSIVAEPFPPAYTSLVEEIRGDALAAVGKIKQARQAYDRALLTATGDTEYLRLKRNNLGGTPAS